MPGLELQIVSNPPAERADSARNRRKILRSAEQLLYGNIRLAEISTNR
ncbi:hypothetical protein [Saccharopolyspora shandongensis]